jgi:hypothetical protein
MESVPLLDCAGRRRSPATLSSLHQDLSKLRGAFGVRCVFHLDALRYDMLRTHDASSVAWSSSAV